jgi:predicted nucleic acid-binding protein
MIVVSDTTPLRHLAAIGIVDLLRQLYQCIIVPKAVWQELHAEATPAVVKTWLDSAPDWLEIRSPVSAAQTAFSEILDLGECEAIQLAIALKADLLIMDDREARTVALQLRLPVVGTLGVLERADLLGLLADFRSVLRELEASGFYLSDRLREAALERYRLRHEGV